MKSEIFQNRSGLFIKPQRPDNTSFNREDNNCFTQELRSSIDQLKEELERYSNPIVLRATFLIVAESDEVYRTRRDIISTEIANSSIDIPSFSVVAQSPDLPITHIVEVELLDKSDEVDCLLKSVDDISYWVLKYGGVKELVVSGCGAYGGSVEEMSRGAFVILDNILKEESMDYSDIVRQWNYIGLITLERDNRQNYQVFNDIRSIYYNNTKWDKGYPAATGIGMESNGILIDLNAVAYTDSDAESSKKEITLLSISNPRQIDAHAYSDGVLVGEAVEEVKQRTSPKFERAKGVLSNSGGMVYVSGTASIIGEETVGLDNVEEQTEVTMENIILLVDTESQPNLEPFSGYKQGKITKLRAYVKRREYDTIVRNYMTKNWSHIPFVIVRADVCRDNLLVEIEGEYRY